MSNHTTVCANVLCANSGKMNALTLETSSDSNTGAITSSTNSVPLLTLKNTNTDANSGAVMQMKSHPSDNVQADDDEIGLITFVGVDDAGATAEYGAILCSAVDASAGSENGKLSINVTAGGARTEVMSMTSAIADTTAAASTVSIPGVLTTRENFVYITSTGNHDLSSSITGSTNIFVNVALADTNYIRLPEATTSNGGMHIRVIMGISPADNAVVGFKTSVIVGGATTTSDGTAGIAASATVTSVAATVNHSVTLDIDGAAGDGSGMPGTILDFYYPGVANIVLYRGDLIGFVDSCTLANHFSTAEVDA